MKRFRVTALRTQQVVDLFNSSESLFMWHQGEDVDDEEMTSFSLRLGDFLDVELIGFEFVKVDDADVCFNLVQVAHARATENESGHTVNPRLCWVSNDIFPLREFDGDRLKVRKLADDEGIKLPHPLAEDE